MDTLPLLPVIAGGIIFLLRRYCAKVKQNYDNVQFSVLQHEPSRVVGINFRYAEPDLEINQKPPCKFVPVPTQEKKGFFTGLKAVFPQAAVLSSTFPQEKSSTYAVAKTLPAPLIALIKPCYLGMGVEDLLEESERIFRRYYRTSSILQLGRTPRTCPEKGWEYQSLRRLQTHHQQSRIVESYPIPCIEDLFASLAGGIVFSKLDLSHAYQQLELDDASKGLAVVNTHKGLFRYNRLPFGVPAAPAIFQRTIESLLQDIPSVCVYLDDILGAGTSEEDHIKNLDTVMTRHEDAGARLKRESCEFLLPEITYLGHKISAKGLQPTDDKVEAVTSFPTPRDVSQLKAFLGKVNYYARNFSRISPQS